MTLLDQIAADARHPDFVARNVTRMRSALRERTMFGPAGRAVIRSAGERVLYGPNGRALCRITEDPMRNTQVEEDERLHAVMRPQPVIVRVDPDSPIGLRLAAEYQERLRHRQTRSAT